jgi:hypothetical protein
MLNKLKPSEKQALPLLLILAFTLLSFQYIQFSNTMGLELMEWI